jgi:hypothetical protein
MAAIKHDVDVQQKMMTAQNNEKMSKMRTKSTNTNTFDWDVVDSQNLSNLKR